MPTERAALFSPETWGLRAVPVVLVAPPAKALQMKYTVGLPISFALVLSGKRPTNLTACLSLCLYGRFRGQETERWPSGEAPPGLSGFKRHGKHIGPYLFIYEQIWP